MPHASLAAEHGLRHLRTGRRRPQTNVKAEAFVKILQNGWAYGRPYGSTAERIAALPRFLSSFGREDVYQLQCPDQADRVIFQIHREPLLSS